MADNLYPLPPPPPRDLAQILEQHLATSLPPDLAFDLVLNELVVRAADATHASSAALALLRGDEMVCRASTGTHAPGLGVPLDMRDGLTGSCIRTHTSQLCSDAETDPRVDSAAMHRLGIRSMLVVPVFDRKPLEEEVNPHDAAAVSAPEPALIGVIEILSPYPNAFSQASQSLLEEFAGEVSNVREAADKLRDRISADAPGDPGLLKSFDSSTTILTHSAPEHLSEHASEYVLPVPRRYEAWTLVLGGLVIFAAIGVSFMVGSRVGWLRSAETASVPPPAATEAAVPVASTQTLPAESQSAQPDTSGQSSADATRAGRTAAAASATARTTAPKPRPRPAASPSDNPPPASSGELVVYDKGKVIFRMKQPTAQSEAPAASAAPPVIASQAAPARSAETAPVGSSVVSAASNARIASPRAAWLAPAEAEERLLTRVEPQYPANALAAHRSGSVVLEVNVAEDGTVSSVRTLIGDPVLAAAATQAVRSWRYQPYRPHDQPSPFQTDVTLTFSLPN
ncbi:MAG: TonB family protein [Terriglobales bacterium]